MRSFVYGLAPVLIVGWCLTAHAEDLFPYQIGQTWVYENNGGSEWHKLDKEGIRTRSVLKKEKVNDIECWIVKDHYSQDGAAAMEYISVNTNALHEVRADGDNVTVKINPPVESPLSLQEKEEKSVKDITTYHSKLKQKNAVKIYIERTTKRLPDEDITVPAGTFHKCKRISIKKSARVGNPKKGDLSVSQTDQWYDRKIGLVKEVIQYEALLDPNGNTLKPARVVISELKSYRSGK